MQNSKSKNLNPKQYPNQNIPNSKRLGFSGFKYLNLFRIWGLEFRTFQQRGISLIEVVVMVFVATVLLFSIAEVAKISFRTFSAKKLEYRAVLYLTEGAEAVRAMRDESWLTNIAPLTASSTYYIVPAANSWTASAANPGALDGVFTRTLVLQNVYRDATDAIASSGALDADSRKATVSVSWSAPTGPHSLSVDTYIMNYLKN